MISFNAEATLIIKPWSFKDFIAQNRVQIVKHMASGAQLFEELAHCEVLK